MNNSQQQPKKPSQAQISYLRDLALRCGESFAYPQSATEAKAEIERLKTRKRTDPRHRRRETGEVSRDLAERRGDATSVRPEEISGYGSSARWR